MSYERREFAGGAVAATVTVGLAGATSAPGETFTISATTGWPTGAAGKFTVVVDRATASEEKILCTSRSGGVVTIDTRGYDGTTGVTHVPGSATVELCITAVDVDEANRAVAQTIGLVTTKGDSIVASSANTFSRLPVGTDNHVRIADAAQTTGQKWGLVTPVNVSGLVGITKGGLATATGTNTFATLAVGTNDQVLIADSTAGTGNKWGQVATGGIADEAITGDKIAASAIGNTKLQSNSVNTLQLFNGAVTTDKIADAAITEAKLAVTSTTSYTPSWTAAGGTAPAIGSGTLTGRYMKIGKMVDFWIYLRGAADTTWGSGVNFWSFTLPPACTSIASQLQPVVVLVYDSSGSNYDVGDHRQAGVFGGETTVLTNLHSTAPVTFANQDVVAIYGRIEVQ
jgi:hypothetical protein